VLFFSIRSAVNGSLNPEIQSQPWYFPVCLLCKTDAAAGAADKPTGFAGKRHHTGSALLAPCPKGGQGQDQTFEPVRDRRRNINQKGYFFQNENKEA